MHADFVIFITKMCLNWHSGPPCRHRILSQNFKYLFFYIELIDKYQVSTVQKTKIDVLEKSNFHNSPKLLKLKMIWKICWKGHNYLKSKACLTSLTFRSVLWLYQIVLCQVLRILCKTNYVAIIKCWFLAIWTPFDPFLV